MSEYTPSEGAMLTAWHRHVTEEDSKYGRFRDDAERATKEFVRFMDRVRRDAAREALREAADAVHDNAASPYCLPCHRSDADLLRTIADQEDDR